MCGLRPQDLGSLQVAGVAPDPQSAGRVMDEPRVTLEPPPKLWTSFSPLVKSGCWSCVPLPSLAQTGLSRGALGSCPSRLQCRVPGALPAVTAAGSWPAVPGRGDTSSLCPLHGAAGGERTLSVSELLCPSWHSLPVPSTATRPALSLRVFGVAGSALQPPLPCCDSRVTSGWVETCPVSPLQRV